MNTNLDRQAGEAQNRIDKVTRRSLLKLSPLLVLAGCDVSSGGRTESLLRSFQKFNDLVQEKIFSSAKLAPEYSDDAVTPEDGFRVNGKDADDPDIDLDAWALTIEGMVTKPGTYSLERIKSLARR